MEIAKATSFDSTRISNIGHRQSGYKLFFTTIHNVDWSSTSFTFGKIDIQSHLPGLITIQIVDLIMIKHVTPMFS